MNPHRFTPSGTLRLALVGAAITASAYLSATERVVAGRWEYTMTTDGVPRVMTRCMAARDASDLNADTAVGKAAAEKQAGVRCTVKSYTAEGKLLDYTLVCGARTIRNATVFQGETSKGTTTTTFDGVTSTTQIVARRLGACEQR